MDVLSRYSALYANVPLFGGAEWKSLGIDELVALHVSALEGIQALRTEERDKAIAEEQAKLWIVRKFRALRGWAPPVVPTRQELFRAMIARASDLSQWMTTTQYRDFYAGSDMSAFIRGPAAVSRELKRLAELEK
jgi:hypothetical protein